MKNLIDIEVSNVYGGYNGTITCEIISRANSDPKTGRCLAHLNLEGDDNYLGNCFNTINELNKDSDEKNGDFLIKCPQLVFTESSTVYLKKK